MATQGKVDRRVRRTKESLRRALEDLLAEKPIQSITVRELADRVDINRGTFYLHYRDVHDLLEQIEEELFEELMEVIKDYDMDEIRANLTPFLTNLFTYLFKNERMIRVLLSNNGDLAFVNRVRNAISEKCLYSWIERRNPEDLSILNYTHGFIIAGFMSVLEMWLTSDMRQTPEEMAVLLDNIIMGGVKMLNQQLLQN